ncbi:right-handed parallel beta-helix repeat-containing protein [Psychrobacillus sp. FSL K6-4046]|uniref:right-handed parallel beta-helix repeat-containing protein n=1 Tax=Psychrobacillus sp. FSL K6-4046 TaxID=2921550 RepID=UPI00315B0F6C
MIPNSIKVTIITFLSIIFFVQINSVALAENSSEKNYYVSPKGKDANPGTKKKPWKTIQHAAKVLEPGDTVFVRGGVYSEFIHITKSGSKNLGNITFQSFPGEVAILEGKKLTVTSAKRAFFYIDNASYIRIEGFELRNLKTRKQNRYPVGILVKGGSSNIHLSDNNIHHIENKSRKGNAHGILIYGNTSNAMSSITVNNNEIHHLKLGSSEALTFSGNIQQFAITHNEIHHNNNIGIDVAGFYNACETDDCVDQARDGIIANNKVYKNSSKRNVSYKEYSAGGIYADGSTQLTIVNNIVAYNDFGIELASEKEGKTSSEIDVKNNIIYSNNGAGIIAGGAEKNNGGSSNNNIVSNVLMFNDQSDEGYGEITLQWNTKENQILNNLIYSKEKDEYLQNLGDDAMSNIYLNNTIHSFEEKPFFFAPVTAFFKNLRWW